MMFALILMAVQAVPYLVFSEPPTPAPMFRYWVSTGVFGNPADAPASMSIPADLDIRDYLNERDVCPANDSVCRAFIRYRLTLDAKNPDAATRAVIQYVIAGPTGIRHEGCAWLNMDRTERHDYVLQDGEWTEQRLHPSTMSDRKMVNMILLQGVRHLKKNPP